MIGLLLKVLAFFFVIIIGIFVVLDLTGVAKHGTLSFKQPDAAPCRRYAKGPNGSAVLKSEVQWIWTANGYGWGCALEYEDGTKGSITPMPR